MNTTGFHFKVGGFECISVFDGYLSDPIPYQVLFQNATKETLEQVLHSYNLQMNQWIESFTCLVIQTGEHRVLVDTGLGIIESVPTAGKLLLNLRNEGIEPNDIDTVIISHAHGDHIGGNTDLNARAAFPQARYYIPKDEWNFWTSETTLNNPHYKWMVEFVNKSLLPIQDRFHMIEYDTEIVPGIKTLSAAGHTPGNQVLLIESSGEQLMYLGDVVLHPIHFEHPEWHSSPDYQPAQAVRTRRSLLELAASEQALTFAFHFDFPCLGYVLPQAENWKWRTFDPNK